MTALGKPVLKYRRYITHWGGDKRVPYPPRTKSGGGTVEFVVTVEGSLPGLTKVETRRVGMCLGSGLRSASFISGKQTAEVKAKRRRLAARDIRLLRKLFDFDDVTEYLIVGVDDEEDT